MNTRENLERIVADLGSRQILLTLSSIDRECLERGQRYSSQEIGSVALDAVHKGIAAAKDNQTLLEFRRYAENACPHCNGERSLGDCQVTRRLSALANNG